MRKLRLFGTFAIFFQCFFFKSETQVLMADSDFFSRNRFLEGGFTLQWKGVSLLIGGGHPMGRASALMGGGFRKKSWDGGAPLPCPPPPMGNPAPSA